MAGRAGRFARLSLWRAALWLALTLMPAAAAAAPSAAFVMDARTGQVLFQQNADARLHPASLTKMMTLYVAFTAIRRGEVSLDTMVSVSAKAAAEPPSRLGLRSGQRITLRNLIRAAAIKSANDASTAIAEAISGSEAAFARRMTETARALGMRNTTFRNAHGLTAEGHLSTARDMTILGRRLFYDFPEYYSLFSRVTIDAGVAQVANTNRRFLESYPGADGIKTGYTRAAGFNLTASAERGNKRLIATVFGGTSTAQRNARMAALLDQGFGVAPANVATRRPPPVDLPAAEPPVAAGAGGRAGARTIRLAALPERSPRPRPRPAAAPDPAPAAVAMAAPAAPVPAPAARPARPIPFAVVTEAPDSVADAIEGELRAALAQDAPGAAPRARPTDMASAAADDLAAEPRAEAPAAPPPPAADEAAPPAPDARLAAARPAQRAPAAEAAAADDAAPEPAESAPAALAAAPPEAPAEMAEEDSPLEELPLATAAAEDDPADMPAAAAPHSVPAAPAIILTARNDPAPAAPAAETPEAAAAPVVLTLSTSGARHWGISLGRYGARGEAERALLMTGLAEPATLGAALRKVVPRGGGFEATFAGLTPEEADVACRRLAARAIACAPLGP